MSIPHVTTFRTNVLSFLDRCGPNPHGVYDSAGWERSGESRILSPTAVKFVRPVEERGVVVRTLAERCRIGDWAFASTPGGCESLEGGHSAVEALYLLRELDRLTPADKANWVAYFNQYQDRETGYYLGPYVPPRHHHSWRDLPAATHPWDHMHDHLIASLCPTLMLLGGKSKYPLSAGSQTGRFLDRGYLEHFLIGRDWNAYAGDGNYRRQNPWWMGNEFWYPACILWQISVWEAGTPAGRQARELLDQVWYAWHDANFDATGFWSGDLAGPAERRYLGRTDSIRPLRSKDDRRYAGMLVMGGAHQLWFYDFERHAIPKSIRRRQTDTVLLLHNPHTGHFGLGDTDNPVEWSNNCTDVDCISVLSYNHAADDYRRDEIERALLSAMWAILSDRLNDAGVLESVPGQPFTHNFNSVETFSPAGWGNVLNQSFYLWAIICVCRVVRQTTDSAMQSWLDRDWPSVPSHWLWAR